MNRYPINFSQEGPGRLNSAFVVLFLFGVYIGLDARIAAGLPVPTVIAGFAGLTLLVINRNRINPRHVGAICLIIVLYLASILCAPDYSYLKERFKGLVQISYSLIVGYGLFVGLLRFNRKALANLLLSFCTVIVIGCAFENYTGFRAISDAVRETIFSSGVYIADLRDQLLYGRIRPKLFSSEPSLVTFAYALLLFAWYVVSTWKSKMAVYILYLGAGFFLMRGPTLMLGLALILPYQLFIASRVEGDYGPTYDARRVLGTMFLSLLLVTFMVFLIQELYSERLRQIFSGRDASFVGRMIAPALTALEMVEHHPIAGAGLVGWEFIDTTVRQIYANETSLVLEWAFEKPAEAITNYFWEHWIFLGLFWGMVLLAALSGLLKTLGSPSIVFPWLVWIGFGNAAGAYVAPRTWTVFFVASAVAILHQRERAGNASWELVVPHRARMEPFLEVSLQQR